MLQKLQKAEEKYEEIGESLSSPEVMGDMELYKKLMREHKALSPMIEKYRELKAAMKAKDEAEELLSGALDSEMRELCEEELKEARQRIEQCTEELKILLIPKDPNDYKNVIIEIRGGAGGEEAALFSAVLYRMYSMYADSCGFSIEPVNANETELGGYKEVSFSVIGEGAYSKFKYESGVHRVQRVPETEAGGRIHTSTVTVAVLPEAEDVEVEINESDLEIDAHRASGAGGQHVNKTDSAIRILHKPSGIVVECQDERSQYKNRDKAMKLLRTKLYEAKQKEQADAIASERKSQVGTGDRSERIRTYNYPQRRVTDHRIGLTLYTLEEVLNGKLDEIVEALATAERTKAITEGNI